jgi:cyclopropane-fatty-acyl-phospholipid synthase
MTSPAGSQVSDAHPFSAHYDVEPDFYRLWLDPTMTYSAALWQPGDTLAEAQVRKLDYLIELAGAEGAKRVLDVGCGWGGLASRLVSQHGVGQVVGLTVSASQAAWVEAWGDPRIEARLEPWADHVSEQPYDAIVSVGAFEHFAHTRSSRGKRVEIYREFFRKMHGQLHEGGRLVVQTVARDGRPLDRDAIADFRLIDRVFPASGIPWPSEVLEAAEDGFALESLDSHADHYRQTVAAWVANIDGSAARARAVVDEATVAEFRQCFATAERLFEQRHATLLRLAWRRCSSR